MTTVEKLLHWRNTQQRMKRRGEHRRELIIQDATDWFIANRDGLDASQERLFLDWLRKSPEHVREYYAIHEIARDLRTVSDPAWSVEALIEQARADDGADHANVEPLPARTARLLRNPWLLAVAASVAGVFVIGLALLSPALRAGLFPPPTLARYATPHGGRLRQPLADGSVLELNTDTAVVVRYSRKDRRIDLLRGQAVFAVVHDPRRPFRVFAGSTEVVDVGTRFDVYLQDGSTRVTVVEGRVEVGPATLLDRLEAYARGIAGGGVVQLGAGQQVQMQPGGAPHPGPADVKAATAWTSGRIVFTRQPLAQVAAEFNRYAVTPLQIAPALRDLPVSGSFNADDTESFIAFLRSLEGVQVEAEQDRVRVSRP